MGNILQQAREQAAAQQAAQGQGQQQGFGFGGIIRMISMYMFIQYMMKGNQPAPVTDPSGKVYPPHMPLWADGTQFDLRVYLSDDGSFSIPDANANPGELNGLLWHQKGLYHNFEPSNDREQNITLSKSVLTHLQNNGSLWAHLFFTKKGFPAYEGDSSSSKKWTPQAQFHHPIQMNFYEKPPKVSAGKNLISGEFADERVKSEEDIEKLKQETEVAWVNYFKPVLFMRLVHDFSGYPYNGFPPEIKHVFQVEPTTKNYYPTLYMDTFWILKERNVLINSSVESIQAELKFSPVSMMRFRLQMQIDQSFKMQESFGHDPEDTDAMKRVLLETNPYFLALTFGVSLLHMIFDFLAFKNDIAFWKENKSMEGLSVQSILLSAGCQVVIFLYLFDNETSWMILLSSGIELCIQCWKIKKAMEVSMTDKFPYISLKNKSEYEDSPTAKYDKEAMKYLSYVLYPLVIGYSVYSLVYQTHKSWYSWVLGSLVGTVYTFGFIMMCPQLYLNYKLQSVAHLPWRMLTYKALNTFIDDLFSFIITMPTLHRLSCFRDDIIFFIYLYQRWKYRTDYNRVNEFGYKVKTPAELEAEAAKDKALADAKTEEENKGSQEKEGDKAADGTNEKKAENEGKEAKPTIEPVAEKATDVRKRKTRKDA